MRAAAEGLEFERAAKLPRPARRGPASARDPGDGPHAARGPRRGGARRGRPRGRVPGVLRPARPGAGPQGWVVDRVEDLDRPGLVASFLEQLYMERQEVPPRVLVPALPADAELLEAWLTARRGKPVRIAVPSRGAKRRLLEVVERNAADAFQRHKLRRASDFGARSRALAELGEQLGLDQAPAADRVLRHLQPRRHRQGRLDGGVRGRAAQASGLPEVRDQGRAGAGRLRLDGRDAPAAGSRACSRSRPARRRSAGDGSPTRRRSSSWTAAGAS